ncbi:MAG: leucine-rich repeat domain-containing protein, partial [Cyanobacteriota bacterium]|nr:leucine-rich repeat domain-containing protein [Cyanobacteriota bacterium]
VQPFDRFADWCENRAELTEAARHTVEKLLEEVETLDCQIADVRLADLTKLYLIGRITDVGPLSSLTNLTELGLRGNQIAEVGPLSGLTNLTELRLGDNQIADVRPLSGLTNLTALNLYHNPLTDRTCPVEPQSICGF